LQCRTGAGKVAVRFRIARVQLVSALVKVPNATTTAVRRPGSVQV
jgi:hypothetical protein